LRLIVDMDSLAAYASDSENEEDAIHGEDHRNLYDEADDIRAEEAKVLAALPSSSSSFSSSRLVDKRRSVHADDILDDVVKPREWEKTLAEKPPKHKKHHKKRKDEKKRIDAFGGLSAISNKKDESDDDEDAILKKKPKMDSVFPKKDSLLAMLPQPKLKANNATLKPSVILLRQSVSKQKKNTERPVKHEAKFIATADSDEDEDAAATTGDFFGLSRAAEPAVTTTLGASYGPMKPNFDVEEQEISGDHLHPSQMYNMANEDMDNHLQPSKVKGVITDEQAHKMIVKHELAPWGFHDGAATAAVSEMIDVSVDETLGPNIRENILKSLGHKAPPTSSFALPGPKTKETVDVNAKRKHQITYLAKMAVAREEQLQEQWSQQRQTKRMASQKYGFR